MRDEVKVRFATMKDYDSLCSLFAQGDKFHADLVPEIFQKFSGPARPRERLQYFVESEDAEAIVAESETGIMGLLTLEKTDYPSYPMYKRHAHAMLNTLVVDESSRRQGVGGILLKAAQDWARKRGVRFLQTNLWYANVAAKNFYTKHGFKTLTQRAELEIDLEEI
jgi:GNAT superfamily N-acetyltransferase